MSSMTKLSVLKLGSSHRAVMSGLLLASCTMLGQAQAACTPEVARRLDAEHPDVRIGSNSRMWLAVFDHAQTYHTRHVRPIHLELQR